MREKIKIDSHKLMYHPKRVAEWLEKGDCFPLYVEIGPTNRCNHRCIFCALDWLDDDKHDIDRKVMLSALEDMATHGAKSVMFAGEGEPLLHKNISEFVHYAKMLGLDVAITTNGVLFDKKKAEECLPFLSWIRFSIDAGTKETYEKVHKAKKEDFNRVIENLRNAVRIKRENNYQVVIGSQALLIPETAKEVGLLAQIVKETGADNLQIKPYSQHPNSINRFVINYKRHLHLESELKKFDSEHFRIFFRRRTIQRLEKEATYNQCHGLSFFALIDAKGNVLPCNLFYDNPNFVYGNLYRKSFHEIWQSQERKDILKKLKKKGVKECRKGCRLDAINLYLQRLLTPEAHDNFI